jgi:ATP-binding cassette, subfamily C, bacterial
MQRGFLMLKIKTDLNNSLELKEETLSIADGRLVVSGPQGEIFGIKTSQIEKAFVEEGLGISKLVIKTKKGDEKEIAYFTKSKVKSFRKFTDVINQYIVKKKIVKTSFDEKKPQQGGIGTVYWLYAYTSKHRKLIIVGILLTLITVALNLIPPYLLKILIDNVILSPTHPEALFELLTIILVVSYAASTIVSAIQSYVLNIAGNRIVTRLRSELFKHSVRLSASDIDNITVSRIQTRLITDTGNTQWLMTYGLGTLVTNVLTIVGIGVILFLIFPRLALYVLLPIPFIILFIIHYNKQSATAYHRSWRRSSDLITRINDIIPNYTIVKSATREESEGDAFDKELGNFYDTQIDIQKMELSHWQPVGFLIALSTVIIWWVGGNLVIVGTLQLGVITAFLAYMGMFYGPIQQISTLLPYVQESITSGERLREVFDSKDLPKEPKGKVKAPVNGDINFQNVWFGYDPLFPVLKGINMEIQKGKVTAIVGKSGAGKSTIAKLLLGLYVIDSGDIKFGKTSINNIDIDYLRGKIAYVPQDSSFFDNTITYNMSYYSKEKIAPLQLIATSKAVEMHSEIMRLPLCYDNRIRGRGLSLSGGQRQRLSVARAILGDPDIVLLDEITSNLDAINARKVNKAVLNLESDKTMVFVTHDLNEIMNSDYTIMIENGEITEQGRPSELIRKKGKLYNMFKYKITDRSGRKSVNKKETLQSFVKDFVIKENSVAIKEGERRSFVNATYGSKHAKRLIPKRPFPVSNPSFIIFYAGKDKDLFAIEDYTKLEENSRKILESALEVNNFNPKVIGIDGIKITGDGLVWTLRTDRGTLKYTTKNRSDIAYRGDYVILIDEFNTPLKIKLGDLDQRSASILDKSI